MLVDSWYDPYLGVVILIRVIDGAIRKGQQISFMAAGTTHLVDRVGVFRPKIEQFDAARRRRDRLHHRPDQGRRRDPRRRHHHRRPQADRRGAARLQAGPAGGVLRPVPDRRQRFREAARQLSKLRLNDASFSFEMETSAALGFGFRCGFLGLLHLEIIQERLTREYDLDLITTAPRGGLQYPAQPSQGRAGQDASRSTIRPTCPIPTGSRAWRSRGSRR